MGNIVPTLDPGRITVHAALRGHNAAEYYRVTAPLSVLAHSREADLAISMSDESLDETTRADVVILQQNVGAMGELIARQVHDNGGKVIYDVDDWIYGMPPTWPGYTNFFDEASGGPLWPVLFHGRMVELADLVTCSTDRIADNLIRWHGERCPPTAVLPNCIMQGDWDTLPDVAHGKDGPVLGWFGTATHWDDWADIVHVVDWVLDRVGGYLALVGFPGVQTMFPARLRERTLSHPLVPMRNFGETRRLIRSFDVGLAWCTDMLESNRCRSALKVLQYGAAGVPCVASHTVYGELGLGRNPSDDLEIRDRRHRPGVEIANYPSELRTMLTEMLTNPPDVSEWQAEVFDEHSYEVNANRWEAIILDVLDRDYSGVGLELDDLFRDCDTIPSDGDA